MIKKAGLCNGVQHEFAGELYQGTSKQQVQKSPLISGLFVHRKDELFSSVVSCNAANDGTTCFICIAPTLNFHPLAFF